MQKPWAKKVIVFPTIFKFKIPQFKMYIITFSKSWKLRLSDGKAISKIISIIYSSTWVLESEWMA